MLGYHLTPKTRRIVRKPLGKLITGKTRQTMLRLRKIFSRKPPKYIVAVGDRVSMLCLKAAIPVRTFILDGREKRRRIRWRHLPRVKRYRTENPAGMITQEAWKAVRRAIRNRGILMVKGEEDLLTLPAILESAFGSAVLYGQPKRGIVLVQVNAGKKKAIRKVVSEMSSSR